MADKKTAFFAVFYLHNVSGSLKLLSSLRAVPKARRGNLLKLFLTSGTKLKIILG
ncbi:MAG: hypothetical protein IJM09_01310 [Neisseriaceae bacterium]|nr:hypothetical protein [Neisseriaceae bacterium]